MSTENRSSNQQEPPESADGTAKKPESAPEGTIPDAADPTNLSAMEASFWDESQIQAVVRHAGATGKSPQEFFNKKWKDRLIHGKKTKDEDSS